MFWHLPSSGVQNNFFSISLDKYYKCFRLVKLRIKTFIPLSPLPPSSFSCFAKKSLLFKSNEVGIIILQRTGKDNLSRTEEIIMTRELITTRLLEWLVFVASLTY